MEVPKKIPNLKGKLDPKVEAELYESFIRVYDYVDNLIRDRIKIIESKIQAGDLASQNFNDLIGIFSQPLAGSNVIDPLLQSILQSFGPQVANTVFAGPIPSFRALTLADLPAITAATANKLDADGTILDVNVINDGEFLKRVGATVVSAPVSGSSRNILDWIAF